MNYDLAIFDLDGTLVDTIYDLADAVNHALTKMDYPVHSVDEYRMMVGGGIRNLCMRALPEGTETVVLDQTLSHFVEYYSVHCADKSRPYPGIPELLSELAAAGMRLAVASNKFQAGTDSIIRRFFPDVPFVAVRGGRDGVPLKPDPQVVTEIMEIAGVEAGRTVMVGDSGVDVAVGRAAGVACIGVTWGFRPAEAATAPRVACDAAELAALLLRAQA